MKSGSGGPFATVRSASVPSLGTVSVTDGRGLIQVFVADAGYPISSPDTRLPAARPPLAAVRPRADRLADAVCRSAWRAHLHPHRERSPIHEPDVDLTRRLALVPRQRLRPLDRTGNSRRDRRAVSRRARLPPRQLHRDHLECRTLPSTGFDHTRVEAAATALDFRKVKTFRMPDGFLLSLWWKSSPLERLPTS